MIRTYLVLFPKIRTRTKLKVLALCLILLTCVIALTFHDEFYSGINAVTLIICALWHDYLEYSREDPMPYFADPIIFDIDNIVISSEVFAVNEIEKLKIEINNYDGETRSGRGRWILNGTNNYLSFIYKGKKINVTFYIISEEQKSQFKILFGSWYNNHVSFYEGNGSGKTYLLAILGYHEIQEFKKQHKIT